MASASKERDQILHKLSSLIQVITSNVMPLERELKTAEGRAICADIKTASEEATRLFRQLMEVL